MARTNPRKTNLRTVLLVAAAAAVLGVAGAQAQTVDANASTRTTAGIGDSGAQTETDASASQGESGTTVASGASSDGSATVGGDSHAGITAGDEPSIQIDGNSVTGSSGGGANIDLGVQLSSDDIVEELSALCQDADLHIEHDTSTPFVETDGSASARLGDLCKTATALASSAVGDTSADVECTATGDADANAEGDGGAKAGVGGAAKRFWTKITAWF